jgi:hydrogenase/urease accessory protein HupE
MGRCKWRRRLLLATSFLSLCLPATTRAHSTIEGLEGFVGGVLHPLTDPAHLLIIVALGLLIGQRSPLDFKAPFVVFVPCLAVALIFTTTGFVRTVYQPALIGLALCAAVPVSLEKPVPPLAYRALFAVGAFALGLDSMPEPNSTSILIKTLLGTWIMVIFLVFDIAYYTSLAMRGNWPRMGVRVLGSWIMAISLMVLALSLLSPRSGMALR